MVGKFIQELFMKGLRRWRDFAGGTVDKNSPAKAGQVGSIPGPGRFHTPQSKYTRAP